MLPSTEIESNKKNNKTLSRKCSNHFFKFETMPFIITVEHPVNKIPATVLHKAIDFTRAN